MEVARTGIQMTVVVGSAVASAAREHSGRLLAALMKDLRDFQLAEDCLQDALESALIHWRRNGPPDSPAAWLLQTARRKAIDRIRRARNFERTSVQFGYLLELDQQGAASAEPLTIEDDTLRLIFTCCHPALDEKTRVALTLRTLCGLTTAELARAFVDNEEAMAQRLVRARHKLAKAGIPYEVPEPCAWPERLSSVLAVIYLVFNEGYAATTGDAQLRLDLCEEAIRLGRLILNLCPAEPEAEGLLALMLINHSRRTARTSAQGAFVALEAQDRSLWDKALIAEGTALLERALTRSQSGVYQIQAAISAVHAEAPDLAGTRWREIVMLYDGLYRLAPNPVYLLNRAVAVSYLHGAVAGLDALARLAPVLDRYQPFHAAQADFLRRLGRDDEAGASYTVAISLSRNEGEKSFLEARLGELGA